MKRYRGKPTGMRTSPQRKALLELLYEIWKCNKQREVLISLKKRRINTLLLPFSRFLFVILQPI